MQRTRHDVRASVRRSAGLGHSRDALVHPRSAEVANPTGLCDLAGVHIDLGATRVAPPGDVGLLTQWANDDDDAVLGSLRFTPRQRTMVEVRSAVGPVVELVVGVAPGAVTPAAAPLSVSGAGLVAAVATSVEDRRRSQEVLATRLEAGARR